jgi:hypothetical protein
MNLYEKHMMDTFNNGYLEVPPDKPIFWFVILSDEPGRSENYYKAFQEDGKVIRVLEVTKEDCDKR